MAEGSFQLMDTTIQMWLFGGMAAAILLLGGILWKHMVSCSNYVAVPLAKLNERFTQVERFIVELREMKHLRVDPYLPRAFDDLKRQVDNLEAKLDR